MSKTVYCLLIIVITLDSLVTGGLLRDTNMRNEVRFFFRAGNEVTSVLVMLINYQLPLRIVHSTDLTTDN